MIMADYECSICIGEVHFPHAAECGHTFCAVCLRAMPPERRACPVCRAAMISIRPVFIGTSWQGERTPQVEEAIAYLAQSVPTAPAAAMPRNVTEISHQRRTTTGAPSYPRGLSIRRMMGLAFPERPQVNHRAVSSIAAEFGDEAMRMAEYIEKGTSHEVDMTDQQWAKAFDAALQKIIVDTLTDRQTTNRLTLTKYMNKINHILSSLDGRPEHLVTRCFGVCHLVSYSSLFFYKLAARLSPEASKNLLLHCARMPRESCPSLIQEKVYDYLDVKKVPDIVGDAQFMAEMCRILPAAATRAPNEEVALACYRTLSNIDPDYFCLTNPHYHTPEILRLAHRLPCLCSTRARKHRGACEVSPGVEIPA